MSQSHYFFKCKKSGFRKDEFIYKKKKVTNTLYFQNTRNSKHINVKLNEILYSIYYE